MDIDANADLDTEPRPTWLERLRATPRGVWGLGLMLLALVTPFLVRAWFLSQVPDIGDPFDVAAFCKSMDVPPEQRVLNAHRIADRLYYDEYWARRTGSVPLTGTWIGSSPTRDVIETVVTQGWGAAEDFVKEWVATHEPSLLEWKRATELNGIRFDPTEDLIWWFDEAFNNHFHEFDSLAVLCGRRCEAEHDLAGAFQWYRAGILVRDQLWGAAWKADDLSNILDWAALPEVSAAQLRTALGQLRRDRAARQPASHAIKVEYLRAMNSLRKRDGLATAIRYRSGTQSPMDTKTAVFWRFVYWIGGEPERTRRLYQHLVANQLRGVDLPAPTHRALHTPTSTLIYNDDAAVPLPSQHLSAARIAQAIRMSAISSGLEGSVTGGQLLRDPIFEHFFREARAFPALFELALVLQIHRREHGTFPAQLEYLVPGYIDAVPVDPCDPKALPVRYRLDDPDRATLWSVGGNDVDDNGILRGADALLVVRAPAVVGNGPVPETARD